MYLADLFSQNYHECSKSGFPNTLLYCGVRLRGLSLRGQNDKNLAIFGHFRKLGPSKRTKRGVKIVTTLEKENCSEKIINTHDNVAKFDFGIFFSKCDEVDKTGVIIRERTVKLSD